MVFPRRLSAIRDRLECQPRGSLCDFRHSWRVSCSLVAQTPTARAIVHYIASSLLRDGALFDCQFRAAVLVGSRLARGQFVAFNALQAPAWRSNAIHDGRRRQFAAMNTITMFSGFVDLLDGRDEGQDGSYWLGLRGLTVLAWPQRCDVCAHSKLREPIYRKQSAKLAGESV